MLRKKVAPGPGALRSDVGEESGPELSGHQAVQDEVDGAVSEGQHVHDLPQWVVTGHQERLTKYSGEHPQNGLFGKTTEMIIF